MLHFLQSLLTASPFCSRYQSYEFAYALEYDVRLTGHWGRFLASALQIGIQARGSITEGLSGVETDHEVIGRLPEGAVKGLPDLIAFEVVWQSDKWLKSQVGFDFTMLEEMKAMVYGMPSSPSSQACKELDISTSRPLMQI